MCEDHHVTIECFQFNDAKKKCWEKREEKLSYANNVSSKHEFTAVGEKNGIFYMIHIFISNTMT